MNRECNHKRYAESVACRDCEIERLKAENDEHFKNIQALNDDRLMQAEQIKKLEKELQEEKDGYATFAEICVLMVKKVGGEKALLELQELLKGQDNE